MVRVEGDYVNMNIPDVESLPYVDIKEKKQLPFCPGVYFFIYTYDSRWRSSVGYVGQASDIHLRCNGHERLGNGVIGISWLDLTGATMAERLILEKAYIMAYCPQHNREVKEIFR